MRRPRLTLPLVNPRRRLRDRLLAAMLVVALVPAGVLFVLTAINLRAIIEQTTNQTDQTLVSGAEKSLQDGISKWAGNLSHSLGQLPRSLDGLASTVGVDSRVGAIAPTQPWSSSDGVYVTGFTATAPAPAGSSTPPPADLLVGTAPASVTVTVDQQATTLKKMGQPVLGQMTGILAHSEGFSIADVWILDLADNAALVAPPPQPIQGVNLAANPQGAPVTLLPEGSAAFIQPSSGTPANQWTQPYLNQLLGQWVVSVWALDGNGLVVGADIPLQQFNQTIASVPSVGSSASYPLLLAADQSGRVVVVGWGATGKDFPSALKLGEQLPVPTGAGGRALYKALKSAVNGGPIGDQPISATVNGVSKLLFSVVVDGVSPLTYGQWVLVVAAPKTAFEPNVSYLNTGINKGLTNIFKGAIPLVAILVLVCILLATLLSRLITAPVRALTASAERLAQGHTDEPVPPQGRDEVGELAASLERMRREIVASREVILAASRELEQKVAIRTAELSARNEELLALNELAGSLTRSLDPEAILTGALDAVRAVLPVTGGRGFLVDGEGRLTGHGPASVGPGAPLEEVGLAAYTEDRLVTRPDDSGTLIGLPLSTGAGALGALGLHTSAVPGPEMTALLMAIGSQVGLALRTARLSQEGRDMAVLEERARLAREIHDTLAQQLTGIVIQLEAAQALVSRDPERSLPALTAAQELARSALAEARRSVWDLRPAPLSSTGLVAAAEAEVDRFRRRTGVQARLRAEHMSPPPALRPQAEVALLRITQQALANIAAHSGATRVNVRLRHLDGHVELTVKDNGHGFDTTALPAGSFGIVGMAERVRLAGGNFQVESAPGRGTTVTATLPVTEDPRRAPEPPSRTAVPA